MSNLNITGAPEITVGATVRINFPDTEWNGKRGVVEEQVNKVLFGVRIEGRDGLVDFASRRLTVLN